MRKVILILLYNIRKYTHISKGCFIAQTHKEMMPNFSRKKNKG